MRLATLAATLTLGACKGDKSDAAALEGALEAYSNGDFETAFSGFADDATYTIVDTPNGEAHGRAAIVALHRTRATGFTGVKVKAIRIIEAAPYEVAEIVWSAHTRNGSETPQRVSLQRALVLHHRPDGRVDHAWDFGDDGLVEHQLGRRSRPVPDFQAPTMPVTTAVVRGAPKTANSQTYSKLVTTWSADTAAAAFGAVATDDAQLVDSRTGRATVGKAQIGVHFAAVLAALPDLRTDLDVTITAGDWLVGMTTSHATVAAGYQGAWRTLDIVHFDHGKVDWTTDYVNETALIDQIAAHQAPEPEREPGLESEADLEAEAEARAKLPEYPKTRPNIAPLGVASCDRYITGLLDCVDAMSEGLRGQMWSALVEIEAQWRRVPPADRPAMEPACKQLIELGRDALQSLCPAVKW